MTSQKRKIVYLNGTDKMIETPRSPDREGEWLVFTDGASLILQGRADDVKRVERAV